MKDAGRALDYAATRPELDASRLGFYGVSLGATGGVLTSALEPRLRAVVLAGAGLPQAPLPPEMDLIHFVPRLKAPVLMLNGRNDFTLDYETSQVPLFRLLGTAAEHKRHFVDDQGHVPARQQDMIRETLNWFDRYLGPVQPLE
ncbi:MAG TPA: hypothetical protein VMR21_13665 [Vicinamibacteria bacterium]|nr:hypothetical protein [Vicinamibacteria bacterium]